MYIVRQPQNVTEFTAGLQLLSETFQKRFKTFPRELPHQFFIAVDTSDNNRVVGTINLQVPQNSDEPFEVEDFFDCKINDFYSGPRTEVGEVGRLTSTCDIVSPYLFCAITQFAIRFGVKFFVSFNKKLITRIMKASYQLPVQEFDRPLRSERLSPDYEPYFCNPQDPVVVLTQSVENWVPRVDQLMAAANGTIKIVLPDSVNHMDHIVESYLKTL